MSWVELYDSKGRGPIYIDESDWPLVSMYTWRVYKPKRNPTSYAATTTRVDGKRTTLLMHRLLMKPKIVVDHIDGNGLNNRRSNLRDASRFQNAMNARKAKNASSKYKGVTWQTRDQKWMVQITPKSNPIYLGMFDSEIEAARQYDEAAKILFGEFAKLNGV